MGHGWKLQKIVIVVIFLLTFTLVVTVLRSTVLDLADYNKEIFNSLIMEKNRGNMVKEIDQMINRIQMLEEMTRATTRENMTATSNIMKLHAEESMDLEHVIDVIETSTYEIYGANAVIVNTQTDELLYDRKGTIEGTMGANDTIKYIKETSADFEIITMSPYTAILYIQWEDIYKSTKEKVYHGIHTNVSETNQYIWVDEVVNYDGGDNYAVRRITPNPYETEGGYLSTHFKNYVGEFSHQEVLDDINTSGEAFFTDYSADEESGKVNAKISYAKLYRKYNWIVATGMPLGDLVGVSENIDKISVDFVIKDILIIFVIFTGGFTVGTVLILIIQKKHLSKLESIATKESNTDWLTEAYSRKFGNRCLENLFDDFAQKGCNASVFMMDIDDFKNVNDTYGHAIGDMVLKEITRMVLESVHMEDFFIRWGGEEFVLLIHNRDDESAHNVVETLVRRISSMEFVHNGINFHATTSVGGSSFSKSDTTYKDVLHRADEALYRAKTSGKNKCCI